MNRFFSTINGLLLIAVCFALLASIPLSGVADENVFDNRLDLGDANFSSFSFTSSTTGHQFQVADDFILGTGTQWSLEGVRCTGVLIDEGQGQPTIGETFEFDILIMTDNGGMPTGMPIDPVPGTAIAWRRASATGIDTGVFNNAAEFHVSFDPIILEGGTVYWLIIAPIGEFTFQEILNPTGSGWAWVGRTNSGNAWQGGTDFQDNWIFQARQQDFTLYGNAVSKLNPTYTLVDLGDLPGGDNVSSANGINENGQVVGTSAAAAGYRAFLWDSVGGMQDLGTLTGENSDSWAADINEAGQVVGGSYGDIERAFLWDPVSGMQDLGSLPDDEESYAVGINDNCQIVGISGFYRSFLWDCDNGMQDLGGLPGGDDTCWANDINEIGQVVGDAYNGAANHAFLWDAIGGMQDLGELPGGIDFSIAFSVNCAGQITGGSGISNTSHAFLWDSTDGMQDIGELPGGNDHSFGYAINKPGQIVGRSQTPAGPKCFLWDSVNGMRDLNDLLDATACGWILDYPTAINDAGQIVGYGINPAGFQHAFLLNPIKPTEQEIVSDSYFALRGNYLAGELPETFDTDDAYLKYQPGITINSSEPPVWIEFAGTLPTDSVQSLSITLEASANTVNINQTIEALNWNNGQYELVDSQSASFTKDSVITVDLSDNVGDYVQLGTGSVKIRAGWKANGFVLLYPWTICIDQVIWTVIQ